MAIGFSPFEHLVQPMKTLVEINVVVNKSLDSAAKIVSEFGSATKDLAVPDDGGLPGLIGEAIVFEDFICRMRKMMSNCLLFQHLKLLSLNTK